ncbi:alpha/beta fold hydrolase [Lysobacter sp. S4-A87]|uniref:alpha/beta fold hydrolase n=1 Tax=Lysobacter sp. S4-A87 TaxID=2925843 RepID=UPI001F530E9A|nr:alpha/beta fold hydrolase [Lysobacter sp. S4-A87]UNK50671.1 alpha/beta fold hydrolase [Lysobacter sp. S4-A87]
MPPAQVRHAVLVHGAGGGGWEWDLWCGVLEAHGIACACFDLAPVDAGLAATTFDDYRAQLRTVLEAVPRPRVLIGASLGGLLAATCADAADALVLVNPLPPAPWSARLARREWPDLVPWRLEARLASTRAALADADDATALFAFRRWRDESGAVLRQAQAGLEVAIPECPVLLVASELDEDVPAAVTAALAGAWNASLLRLPGSTHVGPLLGRDAADVAAQVVAWLWG